jgi:diaminohydroxyphosphoribosylaminopyrimidine deaminase / 5-amino-6-(5-phosphoribosylamino)uracil reductase
MFDNFDRKMMRRALELAARGRGHVSPNPLVGCVITRDAEIIGEGWHERYGEAHAEVNAIRNAEANGHSVEGAYCYVTLEPCAHHGKTPPCADLLVEKRIKRCTIALIDPHDKVKEKGIAKLRFAGIEVRTGLLDEEAREINRFFMKHIATKLPYVTMKIAQSADGRSALASGESKWITGEASRKRVHEMRAEYDAVLVGSGTVIADDPELTVRMVEGRHPVRIVLDRDAKLASTYKVFSEEHSRFIRVVATGRKREEYDIEIALHEGRLSIRELMTKLGAQGFGSVLIEAGPTLAASVIAEDVADELHLFTAPMILGGDARPSIGPLGLASLSQASLWTLRAVELFEGGDILSIYRKT